MCKSIVSLNFKAQGPDTLCDTSDWGSDGLLSLRRTRAFMNEKRQMSESEEKEMIVNPFRTSGFSFQQEKERFIPVVLWHILFQRRFFWFHLNLRCFGSLY